MLPPASAATPPGRAVLCYPCRCHAPPGKASWRRKRKEGGEEPRRGVGIAPLQRRWWRHPPPLRTGAEDLDGCSAEGLLKLLKGSLSFGVAGQRLGFFTERGIEGSREEAEALNESALEVSESKESLEFLNGLWLGPVTDGMDLPLVLLDAICTEDVSEELHHGAG